MSYVCAVLTEARRGVRSPEAIGTGGCDVGDGPNSGPLWEQEAFLTTELPLQFLVSIL